MSDPWTEPFESHRDRLFTLAYRMIGTVQTAEDIVQDAYLRWRSVDVDDVSDAGAYLTTIVTRLCLDHQSAARSERETYTGPWLPEPRVEPMSRPDRAAEQSDALSMAALVVLERLPPLQRAVFVLREAFDMPYEEISDVVDETEPYCRKLAQRARDHFDGEKVATDVHPSEQMQLIDAFISAVEDGDAEAVARTLAEDAVVTSDGGGNVTAARRPVEGREHITRFMLGIAEQAPDGLETKFVLVNGRPGLLALVDGEPQSVWAFHTTDGKIQHAYAVVNPEKLSHIASHRG